MTPVQTARPNDTGATFFLLAASARYDGAVDLIIPYINSKGLLIKGKGGRTDLHWAAESGSIQKISMILAKELPKVSSLKTKTTAVLRYKSLLF